MSALKVADLMTRNVETLRPGDDVDLAATLMRLERFNHVPVVEHDTVVGILSSHDVLRVQAGLRAGLSPGELRLANARIKVSEAMSKIVRSVGPETPALEAAITMRESRIHCLPVIERGELVGIITDSDFVDMVIRELSDPGL